MQFDRSSTILLESESIGTGVPVAQFFPSDTDPKIDQVHGKEYGPHIYYQHGLVEIINPTPDGVSGVLSHSTRIFPSNDQWGIDYRRGLSPEFGPLGPYVYEVAAGGGTGSITVAVKFKKDEVSDIFLGDIDEVASGNAGVNIQAIKGIDATRLHLLPGSTDLYTGLREEMNRANVPYINTIYGCVPQALEDPSVDINNAVSHVLKLGNDPTRLPEYQQWGLSLIESVIQKGKEFFPPVDSGEIAQFRLILANRVPDEVIDRLFKENGFTPTPLFRTVTEHHQETPLGGFIHIEETTGKKFEFYKTEECKSEDLMTAKQALEHRESGGQVFHILYVINATRD